MTHAYFSNISIAFTTSFFPNIFGFEKHHSPGTLGIRRLHQCDPAPLGPAPMARWWLRSQPRGCSRCPCGVGTPRGPGEVTTQSDHWDLWWIYR